MSPLRLLIAMVCLLLCGHAYAGVINVPEDYPTIQDAVDAASNGDEIVVAPGVYVSSQEWVVSIYKSVSIRSSEGRDSTIIQCNLGQGGILAADVFSNNASIEGFTVNDGSEGVRIGSNTNVTISSCTIDDSFNRGITILSDGIANLEEVIVQNCGTLSHSAGGGVLVSEGSLYANGCKILNNRNQIIGAGIVTYSNLNLSKFSRIEIRNSEISGNRAGYYPFNTFGGGGAHLGKWGVSNFYNCTFSDNYASEFGSAILQEPTFYQDQPFGVLTLEDCLIVGNECGSYTVAYPTSVTNCRFESNTVTNDYGGSAGIECAYVDCTVESTVFCNNTTATPSGNPHIRGYWIDGGATVSVFHARILIPMDRRTNVGALMMVCTMFHKNSARYRMRLNLLDKRI